MKIKFNTILCVLCLSFCSGCFHWQGHNGNYHVEVDLFPEPIVYPVGAVVLLTPNIVNVVAGAGTYVGLGLASLPISAVALPLQYPFLPGKTDLEHKLEKVDGSQQELELETNEIIVNE